MHMHAATPVIVGILFMLCGNPASATIIYGTDGEIVCDGVAIFYTDAAGNKVPLTYIDIMVMACDLWTSGKPDLDTWAGAVQQQLIQLITQKVYDEYAGQLNGVIYTVAKVEYDLQPKAPPQTKGKLPVRPTRPADPAPSASGAKPSPVIPNLKLYCPAKFNTNPVPVKPTPAEVDFAKAMEASANYRGLGGLSF